MPFEGVTSLNSEDFSFDCASIKFVISISLKFLGTVEFCIVSYKFISSGLKFDHTLYFILFGGGIYLGLYLIVLASNWPEDMHFWSENEKVFTSNLYHGRKFFMNYRKKLMIATVIIIGYSICKFFFHKTTSHSTSQCFSVGNNYIDIAASYYRVYIRSVRCNRTVDGFWNVTKQKIISSRSVFYQYTSFNFATFLLFEYIYNSIRIVWTFSAMIVIGFAMNLSMRFQQFNDRLNRTRSSSLTKSFWNEVHEHYVTICNLVEKTNDMLMPITVAIAFFDFFFLCERIYRQFR